MILSIDLGGTNIQYAVFDGNTTLLNHTMLTEKDFITQLKQIVSPVVTTYSNKIHCIAIGVPGPTVNNIMQGSKPLNYNNDVNFSEVLSSLDLPNPLPIVVKNDLNMAAYCELFRGTGLKHKNFCLVSMSTGIGVAAVNDGRILQGRIEMGHQVFSPEFEPQQTCTNHSNCWVSLASGNGIEKRFAVNEHKNKGTEELFKQVLTEENIDDLQAINAQAFGNLINAYDPEVIVIMGSLGLKQFHNIIPSAQTIECFTINRPIPAIIKSQFEEDIGVIGAYYAAREALNDKVNQHSFVF